jgi:hypothetical protein
LKTLGAKKYVVVHFAAIRQRAATATLMSAKIVQRLCVDIGQSCVPSSLKLPKMGCCAQVSQCGSVGISLSFQSLGETVNVWSA